jgi:acyl carrier protein
VATVMERVQDIVADKLGVEKGDVVLDASFTDDLNADSLDLVELIMAFEEEFSTPDNAVEITDDDAEGITTVEKAIEFLQSNGVKDL